MRIVKKTGIPLYRAENIRALHEVIRTDEYDDAAKSAFCGGVADTEYLDFVERNLKRRRVLEIGCGSGLLAQRMGVDVAVDANPFRLARVKDTEAVLAVAEHLPFDAGWFSSAVYMHGYFQVRSDWEALIEINRVLETGGVFVFDLPLPGRGPLEFGRVFEPRAYVRMLRDFGFEPIEHRAVNRWEYLIAVEKTEDFNWRRMQKMQVVLDSEGVIQLNNVDLNDYMVR